MTLLSSVPSIEFTEAGVVLPTEAAILSGVQSDMDSAFGGGLNPALESPQGQLASSQAAIIADKNTEIAVIVNQVDPQFADGRFQDGIARIYFLTRKPGTPTTVICTITGLVNTFIPAGTLAQDSNGNTYKSSGDITIPNTSTIDAEFQNVEVGAIPCASGTLTQVYQAISGWDTINNDEDGILGNVVESRGDFEYRRKNSVALNARSSVDAIYANVFNVDNVIDVYVTENTTSSTINSGSTNFPIVPHSVYVAAVGGVNSEVAKAIWDKKDLGCDYNGNTTVIIVDEAGYSHPQPTYTVKFERPSSLPILFSVEIVDNPLLPANTVDLIKAAIIARFNGVDGAGRERIGATVYASRYYAPIATISSKISILSILIGTSSATLTSVLPGIDEVPTISSSDIEVVLI
jgi:hypothetical protein